VRKDPQKVRSWTWPHYTLARAALFPALFHCAGGWRVCGREHVPLRGGALIAANHVSYMDPPAIGAALPRRTYYFAKKELFQVPIFDWLIRTTYAFPVDREGDDKVAFRHAVNLLKEGELLTVFPEGGRSPDGTLQPGGRGAALIAARAGAPIIPCAVGGTNLLLPPHAKCLHRALIQVSFGPPIETRADDPLHKVGLQEITDQVMAEIARLQAEQAEWRAAQRRR
jgi:1-acyl-sn-glycerol-3-phosphate acyltransferase